jgi:hypothetical protein
LKSTWFKSSREFEFAKLIEEAGAYEGIRVHDLFGKFLFCSFVAIRQAVHRMQLGKLDEQLEAEYLRVIKGVPEPKRFPEALSLVVDALQEDPHDFLGGVYEQLGMSDKDFRGQVFTPRHVCEMLVGMNLKDWKPDPTHRMRLCEPCVGGGAIAIAAVAFLKKAGFGPQDYFFWCTDVAHYCFHMAYIQLSLLGAPALLIRGDSLDPKPTDEYAPTPVAALYPYVHRESPAAAVATPEPSIVSIPSTLFDFMESKSDAVEGKPRRRKSA